MNKHSTLPIEFEGWDMAGDFGDIQFYDAVFLENFGPFKKGERVDYLTRYDAKGELASYSYEGERLKSCRLKYVVLP